MAVFVQAFVGISHDDSGRSDADHRDIMVDQKSILDDRQREQSRFSSEFGETGVGAVSRLDAIGSLPSLDCI